MGFSNSDTPAMAHEASHITPKKPTFGDNVLSYLQNRYPVAGAVAGQILPGPAPIEQVPLPPLPSYDGMIAQNATPKKGGGLQTLLKFLA